MKDHATIMDVDFRRTPALRQHASGRLIHRMPGDIRTRTEDGKLLTPKQIRARARRSAARAATRKRGRAVPNTTNVEFETLYKPVEEWDMDELARGRPRDRNGRFSGGKPQWITREVHEQAMEQFKMVVSQQMQVKGLDAMDTIGWVLNNQEVDDRGKPMVPAATKLQASTFLLEHIVGKPKQRIEQDISVKLQAILGDAMVNPRAVVNQEGESVGEIPGDYSFAHLPGQTLMLEAADDEPLSFEDDD